MRLNQQEMLSTLSFAVGIAGVKILQKVVNAFKAPKTIPKIILKHFDFGLVMLFLTVDGIFKVRCLLHDDSMISMNLN
jgi:hypothetical protein